MQGTAYSPSYPQGLLSQELVYVKEFWWHWLHNKYPKT